MKVGQVIPEWTVESVSDEKMKTMALLLRDPNPIHWDIEAVRDLGMGDQPINQGPTNEAYVINMLVHWLGDPSRLRAIRVRFIGNVFAGDRVVAGGEVTGLRSDDGLQVADCDVWLDRDDGSRLLAGTAVVVV
jgi:acyl dehydratase